MSSSWVWKGRWALAAAFVPAVSVFAGGTQDIRTGMGLIQNGPASGPSATNPSNPFPASANDPSSSQGQWFISNSYITDPRTGEEPPPPVARTHEFYDNIAGAGGGLAGSVAVRGVFDSWMTAIDSRTNSTIYFGYRLNVTITNDTGTETGVGATQANLHQETVTGGQPYSGTLYGVKLTLDWLNSSANGQWGWPVDNTLLFGDPPLPANTPYEGSPIFDGLSTSANQDGYAWYSWAENVDPQDGTIDPAGHFAVPTWDFGDIAPGQSVSRVIEILLATQSDTVPVTSIDPNADFLIARSSDLKIGQYIVAADPFLNGIVDDGSAYPSAGGLGEPLPYGNASVFFNTPAPGSAITLAMAGVVGLRRRRSRGVV